MEVKLINLNEKQCGDIEDRLTKYDQSYIKYKLTGNISIGITVNETLVAGAAGTMTAFKIFYLSTLFVDEKYRGQGFGKLLMQNIEEKAKLMGANMIRLDTFDWQGAEFYRKIGYEEVGKYENEMDGFSEYFFLKRL